MGDGVLSARGADRGHGCGWEASGFSAAFRSEWDVHQMALPVNEDVAVVAVLGLQQVAGYGVPASGQVHPDCLKGIHAHPFC